MIVPQFVLIILFLILTFFICRHYFIFYWCVMYEIPKIWNSKIEKRRLANLSLSYPLTCISTWLLTSNNSSGRFGFFITIVLIVCFCLFYTMSLIIILSPLINISKKINELSRSLFQDKFDSIFVSVPNKETEFYNQFNNKYFSSSAENFHSLIKLKPLASREKIIWLYSEGNYREKNKNNLIKPRFKPTLRFISYFIF